jgi:hypothetical protein
VGIAFPLCVSIFYWRQSIEDRGILISWATLTVAIVQFALLAETGLRAEHGNLAWGMVFANHVLFVACCNLLLRQPPGWLRRIAFGVLGLHVLSGCVSLYYCLKDPVNAFSY